MSSLPLELRPTIEAFLANCLAVFDDLDATLLEMNPFTFDGSGMPFPLDIRMVGVAHHDCRTANDHYCSLCRCWGSRVGFAAACGHPAARLMATAQRQWYLQVGHVSWSSQGACLDLVLRFLVSESSIVQLPGRLKEQCSAAVSILLKQFWICLQELDDTASFRNVPSKWGDDVEFPLPFGRTLTAAEEYVHSLDEGTGASLKFTVLNPKGRVWLMVAGGGASVIYAGEVLAGVQVQVPYFVLSP